MPHNLRTERLVLRPACLRGARPFWREVRDWRVMRSTSSWPYPLGFAQCAFMMRKVWEQPDGAYVFFIVRDGQPIGSIGLHADHQGAYWLGYMLGVDHWRRGYATEAVKGILRFGFGPLRTRHIWAEVAVGNDASMKVLRKSGFSQSPGTRMSYSRAHGGDVPIIRFDLQRTEYTP